MTNTTDKEEFDDEMKALAEGAYNGNKKLVPKDWINFASENNPKTGFQAEIFFKNGTVVIAIRGTDEKWNDLVKEDILHLGLKKLPNQYVDAQKLYNKVKKDFPAADIVFTGHSLGGSLAQLMGNKTGCETVTFNAYGVADLLKDDINSNLNIRNYGNIKDTVFNINLDNQLGKTYIIKKNDNAEYVIKGNHNNYLRGLDIVFHHSIEAMGNLKDAVEYKKSAHANTFDYQKNIKLKGKIDYNIDFKNIDTKRIFTREEIAKMSMDEYEKNEDFILQQMSLGNIMTKAQADEEVKLGNLIWVEAYVRRDGTHVSGYYRRR